MRHHFSSSLAGNDVGCVDLVPGNPPVPITVWRTPAHPDNRPGLSIDADPLLPDTLIRQLADAYTRPGDRVLDLTPSSLLATVAGSRRVTAGIIDDGDILAAGCKLPATATVCLVAACWPMPGSRQQQREATQTLMRGARRWLKPRGVLALLAANPPGQPPTDYGPVIAAADAAGLGYLQHLVAIRTPVTGDMISGQAGPAGPPPSGGPGTAAMHVPVHADVFIYTPRGGALHG